jgi:hypothetical protein
MWSKRYVVIRNKKVFGGINAAPNDDANQTK